MGHLMCQMLKITFEYILKTWKKTDDPLIRIYVNKIGNRIKFKIKT